MGDVVIRREVLRADDGCMLGDRLVILRADPTSLISAEILREFVDGRHHPTAEFGEGVLWFGTEGVGEGRVCYEIDDPRLVDWLRGDVQIAELTMRRVA